MLGYIKYVIVLVFISLFIVSCGGGGGDPATGNDNDNGDNGDNGGNTPPAVTIEQNKPYVFYTFTVDQSYYDPTVGQVEADTQVHIAVDLNTSTTTLMASNYSPSYANGTQYFYTTGDELYLKQDYDPREASGSVYIDRYDFANQYFSNHIFVSEPNATNRKCFTITDQRYYYWNSPARALEYVNLQPGGWQYTSIFVEPGILSGGPDGCYLYGTLDMFQGNMYHVYNIAASFPNRPQQTRIRRVINGRLITVNNIDHLDGQLYDRYSYQYSIDDTYIYYTRRRSLDSRIEVWRIKPGARIVHENIYSGFPGFRADSIDSDDGFVVVGGQTIDGNLTENTNGRFLTIDATNTDATQATSQLWNAGQWYYNLEIGYFK